MKKLISMILLLGILLSFNVAATGHGYFGYYGVDPTVDKLNNLAAEHGDGAVIRAFTRYTPFPYQYNYYSYPNYRYHPYYSSYYDYYTYPRQRAYYRDYGPTAYSAYHANYPYGYRNYQYSYSEDDDPLSFDFRFRRY